jgi:hypothetical protein
MKAPSTASEALESAMALQPQANVRARKDTHTPVRLKRATSLRIRWEQPPFRSFTTLLTHELFAD